MNHIVNIKGGKVVKNTKVSMKENYNEETIIELDRFRRDYDKEIEKYLNMTYDTDLRLERYKTDMYYDLYLPDKILISWYYTETAKLFKKMKDIIEKHPIDHIVYGKIQELFDGFEAILAQLWLQAHGDKYPEIYGWLMEVPYMVIDKIGAIVKQ